MKNRDFETWLEQLKDSVATWKYYTDFDKVYKNIDNIKVELNILNSLVGSKNVENDFKILIEKYPEIIKCIPILIAKREYDVIVKTTEKDYNFNFKKPNYTVDEYCEFMEKTGLFDLLQNRIISNIVDYVTGVEVGLDSNARKNRTGHAMENIVEEFIVNAGFKYGLSYFKEMRKTEIENHFNIDLSGISNNGKTEKRFDFVIFNNNKIFAIEVNFYASGGSKLNETARSYKNIALESKSIDGFEFVWITDGIGWNTAKNNLRETFDVMEHIYNISDLKNDSLHCLI